MRTKAAVLYEPGKPLVIETIDLEGPKEGEVLVKYGAAGLCHSDLSIITGVLNSPRPIVLGHEGAGVVQEIGPGVTRVKPRDHVGLAWVPVCGNCYYCLRNHPHLCVNKDLVRTGTMLDGTYRTTKANQNIGKQLGVGSFSEYNVVNEESCIPIEPDIPFEVAAVAGCAGMTGVGAALNTAQVSKGGSVAVLGVGGVGLCIIQGAVLGNATTIIAIDVLDNKLEYARQFGATHCINSAKEDPVKKVMEITNGIGTDYAFEAIGKEVTTRAAFNLIRRGGKAIIVGIPNADTTITIPIIDVTLGEKQLRGSSYGSMNIRVDLPNLLSLYKTGRLKIEEMISNRYSLEEINQGFDDLKSGKNIRGVVIY